jgi:diguanylate cyclase (GGDEF)-like protein
VLSRNGDKDAVKLAAAQARIAELETELNRLAGRDSLVPALTTLPVLRAQLALDVQRAERHGRSLTVAVVDIDRFRYLNMSRGYGVGDAVLAAVGQMLADRTRIHDLACRAGGDEFIVMLPETTPEESRFVFERILVDLEALDAGEQHGVSASVGVAGLRPGEDADSLLGHAAKALADARAAGGGSATGATTRSPLTRRSAPGARSRPPSHMPWRSATPIRASTRRPWST